MKNAVITVLLSTLALSVSAFPQSPADTRTLAISGRPGSVRLVQLSGRSYVAIDDLARLAQASISFKGNQTILAFSADQASAPTPPPPPQAKAGFSQAFLDAAIEQISAIREWRTTIVNSIKSNAPAADDWIARLRRRAEETLALTAAARSTNDDRSGYSLVAGEFSNMLKLSDQFLDSRKKMQYIDPNHIDDDPLNQQILACAKSLASMAADNQFRTEVACSESQ